MASIEELKKYCSITVDRHERGAYVLSFSFGEAVTTVRVVFMDVQSGADMAITHMTTLPAKKRQNGFGSHALRSLLDWARRYGIRDIQAVQVQTPSEKFWERNGFVKIGNITNDFRYVL